MMSRSISVGREESPGGDGPVCGCSRIGQCCVLHLHRCSVRSTRSKRWVIYSCEILISGTLADEKGLKTDALTEDY